MPTPFRRRSAIASMKAACLVMLASFGACSDDDDSAEVPNTSADAVAPSADGAAADGTLGDPDGGPLLDSSVDAVVVDAACDLSLPQNCGACGVDCSGGLCDAGVCTLSNAGYFATRGVAVAGGVAYMTSLTGLARCSASGCLSGGATPIVSFPISSPYQPTQLALDAPSGVAYWASYSSGHPSSGVYRTVLADGGTVQLNAGHPRDYVSGVALGPSLIFFTAYELGGSAFACATTGCTDAGPRLLPGADGNSDGLLALPNAVAYSSGGKVLLCDGASCGSNVRELAIDQGLLVRAFAAHGDDLYWAASYPSPAIVRRSMAVGAPPSQVVLPQVLTPSAMLVLGNTLYWTIGGHAPDAGQMTTDGAVRKCLLPACASPVDIATGQPAPAALATDGQAIYWVNSGAPNAVDRLGSLRKAPL